jgi:hypothetical protein
MTRGQMQAIASVATKIGLIDQAAPAHVQQLRTGRLALRGIFDVDMVAAIVAGAIVAEIEAKRALDADLVAAERQVVRVRQQVRELAPGQDAGLLGGLLDGLVRLDEVLMGRPAQSLAGAAAKVRRATALLDVAGMAAILLSDAIRAIELELLL